MIFHWYQSYQWMGGIHPHSAWGQLKYCKWDAFYQWTTSGLSAIPLESVCVYWTTLKFAHLSRYTRYCLVVPVLHDSMMISQVRVGMFCCLSLFRTRDKPSVEAWAIMGGFCSCCVVVVVKIPPWVEVLADWLTSDRSWETKLEFSTVVLWLRLELDLPAAFEEFWITCWKGERYTHICFSSSNTLRLLHMHQGLHAMTQRVWTDNYAVRQIDLSQVSLYQQVEDIWL